MRNTYDNVGSNLGSPGARKSPAPHLSAKRLTTTKYVERALKPLSTSTTVLG